MSEKFPRESKLQTNKQTYNNIIGVSFTYCIKWQTHALENCFWNLQTRIQAFQPRINCRGGIPGLIFHFFKVVPETYIQMFKQHFNKIILCYNVVSKLLTVQSNSYFYFFLLNKWINIPYRINDLLLKIIKHKPSYYDSKD